MPSDSTNKSEDATIAELREAVAVLASDVDAAWTVNDLDDVQDVQHNETEPNARAAWKRWADTTAAVRMNPIASAAIAQARGKA